MKDQSQDFEQLRQLLALKRHENPPPGYFRDFSTRVIERIEREGVAVDENWLQRVISLFRVRPAISASFCLASLLVLLAATTLFEGNQSASNGNLPTVESKFAVVHEPSALTKASGTAFFTNLEPTGFALDMAPPKQRVFHTNTSLFDMPYYLRVDYRVDYTDYQTEQPRQGIRVPYRLSDPR
ncbi:hypothetical protein GC207_13205 [bacterium]|nr:hypothetical protein [bacterium]